MFNLIYYLPVSYDYVLTETNGTLDCFFTDKYSQELISYMDLANRVIMPAILVLMFSILLGIEIIKSKSRILGNFAREENKIFFNNIRLAITSIILNIIYVILQTPISVYYFLPNFSEINGFGFFYYLLYFSYSINFYIIVLSNSLFRKEFILFLKNLNK